MATQSINGMGYEYACASAILERYSQDQRQLAVEQPSIPSFLLRQQRFSQVKPEIQPAMRRSARGLAHQLATSNERWAKGLFNPSDSYRMRIGDDARNMDVRDLLLYSEKGVQLGLSLKWNSEEIKSLRLGDRWFRQFHIDDDSRWQVAIGEHHRRLARFETWREAIGEFGLDGVYGVYRDAIIDQLQQGMHSESTVRALSEFLFGKQSYLKAMAIARGRTLQLAYYDTANLPTRIREIVPSHRGEHYLEISFDRGWELLLRLHNKDSEIKPDAVGSGMSVTITVTGWGEKAGRRCWEVA